MLLLLLTPQIVILLPTETSLRAPGTSTQVCALAGASMMDHKATTESAPSTPLGIRMNFLSVRKFCPGVRSNANGPSSIFAGSHLRKPGSRLGTVPSGLRLAGFGDRSLIFDLNRLRKGNPLRHKPAVIIVQL